MSTPEIRRYKIVPSTMELAHAMARNGAGHGSGVIAEEQTGARGTHGRAWSAGRGGIWASIIAMPPDRDALEVLSLRLGMMLALVIEEWLPGHPKVMVKWPNDLLLEGKKLGGILCEARWQGHECRWVVVGVGINVTNDIPRDLAEIVTRLADHVVGDPQLERLTNAVFDVVAMSRDWSGALSDGELAAWAERDALSGHEVTAPLEGIASGITARGALRILGSDGIMREVNSGVARNAI